VEYERQERESDWSKAIDCFEQQIVDMERQFKAIRNKEEEVFEQASVDLFHLEEQFQNKMEQETITRKTEHDTVVRLVA
jgi:Holliday junction resolvasome RuvABC endonuclease subunit